MLAKVEAALLANPAGIDSVGVDGENIQYGKLLEEREYWLKQVAIAAGTRPRSKRIDLSGF